MNDKSLGLAMHSRACRSSTEAGRLIELAHESVNRRLPYSWTKTEQFILDKFFTNTNRRAFFVIGLPSTMGGQFFTMCAEVKNNRGMRGVFVDRFFPILLSTLVEECVKDFDSDGEAFLNGQKIDTLDKFIAYSDQTRVAYQTFTESTGDYRFFRKLAASARLKKHLPNSHKLMGQFLIGFDGVSLLTAQSLLRSRVGFGSDHADMQLSQLFPEFSGRDRYPIELELEILGVDPKTIIHLLDGSFDLYYKWRGKQNDGPFPDFLRKRYKKYVDKDDLESGVIGESYNVLSAFVPACLYTSFGIPVKENEFSDLLRALLADEMPEGVALVDMLNEEAATLGYSLDAHLDSSLWSQFGNKYLSSSGFEEKDFISDSDQAIRTLGYSSAPQNTSAWARVLEGLLSQRREWDLLPANFRTIEVGVGRLMSFGAWCAVQRSPFNLSERTALIPHVRFYSYEKPAPDDLDKDFLELHGHNLEIASLLKKKDVPINLQQYVMALGNLIGCQAWGDLRLWEDLVYHGTKFSVPAEIRKFFLGCGNLICNTYPWIKPFFRYDRTSSYLFSHTVKPVEIPKIDEK